MREVSKVVTLLAIGIVSWACSVGRAQDPLERHSLVIERTDGPTMHEIPSPDPARLISSKALLWKSGSFAHRRLFFEEPIQERNSDSSHPFFQPVGSATKFVGRTLLLPIRVFLPR